MRQIITPVQIDILSNKLQAANATEIDREAAMVIMRVKGISAAFDFVNKVGSPDFLLPIEKQMIRVAERREAMAA